MKNRQAEIQKFLLTVEQADLDLIYSNVKFSYYHNWKKHLGILMSKLVNKGLVERIKPGVFKHKKMGAYKETPNPDQIKIF